MTEQIHQAFWSKAVQSLSLQAPLVIQEGASIKSCISAMQDRNIGCAVILNEKGELSGIFTEHDVLNKFVGTDLSGDSPVKQLMSSNVMHLEPEATVASAVDFFGEHHFRHVIVAKNRKEIVGLLSIRVLTTFIAENLPEDILNLPPQADSVSQEAGGA